MGDVVHVLTAIREAKTQRPELQFDWLIEESFADIAQLAKDAGDISKIISIRFRHWRKRKPFGLFFHPDIRRLKHQLRAEQYDVVLDAQGLFKSAFLARLPNVPISGFDRPSAREGFATLCYQQTYAIAKNQHAITRQRQLFAQAFNYELLSEPPSQPSNNHLPTQPHILLLHGTTWDNKAYPTAQWHDVAEQLTHQGYRVLIPHHGEREHCVAQTIATGLNAVTVLPEQRIADFFPILKMASAVISVDTGLAHLAVYLGIPTIMLFGPTRPELTGGLGAHTVNLVGKAADSACMKRKPYASGEFSPSMSAISAQEIITAFNAMLMTAKQ